MLQNKLSSNKTYHLVIHLSEESIINEISINIEKISLKTKNCIILLKQINFVIPSWILFVEFDYNLLFIDISNINKGKNISIIKFLCNVCFI